MLAKSEFLFVRLCKWKCFAHRILAGAFLSVGKLFVISADIGKNAICVFCLVLIKQEAFFMQNVQERGTSPLLVYLAVMFVAALVISNVIANHMLQIGPWAVDAGTLTFPFIYILSDVISEVYGYKWSRRIAWTSLAINAFLALMIILIVRLPQPENYDGVYFATALGNSWRIVVASLVAFCVGDLVDDKIFRYFREKNRVKYDGKENMRGFAFRALVSSLGGHILDSSLFVLIAFAPWPFLPETWLTWSGVPGMIFLNICLKWGYEWAIIPITFKVTKWVAKKENTVEDNTKKC